jgi:hypothetical protein
LPLDLLGRAFQLLSRELMADRTRESGYTYQETYALYDEQLHYARAMYTLEKLDRWQQDWNRYFVQHGMEIPAYAHKLSRSTVPGSRQAPSPDGDSLKA